MAAEGAAVEVACRVLNVSVSGCYARRNRAPSQRSIRHAWLTELIRKIHNDSRQVYGAKRVHAELTLGHGIKVGHGAVELLMQRANISGLFGTTTISSCPERRDGPRCCRASIRARRT